jgi:hypothetical protein
MIDCVNCNYITNNMYSVCDSCNNNNLCLNCYTLINERLNKYFNFLFDLGRNDFLEHKCKFCRNPLEIKYNFNPYAYYSKIIYKLFKFLILVTIPIIYPILLINKKNKSNLDKEYLNINLLFTIYSILIIDFFNIHILTKKKIIPFNTILLSKYLISSLFLSFCIFLDGNYNFYLISFIFPFYLLPTIINSSYLFLYYIKERHSEYITNNTNIKIKLN